MAVYKTSKCWAGQHDACTRPLVGRGWNLYSQCECDCHTIRTDEQQRDLAAQLADSGDVPAVCSVCGAELLTDYEREIGMCAFCDHAEDFYGCRDGAGGERR